MVYRDTLHFLHNYVISLQGLKPRKAFLKNSVTLDSVHISFSAIIWLYCAIFICSPKLWSVCFNLGKAMGFLYSMLGMCSSLKHGLLTVSVSTHTHSWPSCGFRVHTHIPGLWCGLLFASSPLSDPSLPLYKAVSKIETLVGVLLCLPPTMHTTITRNVMSLSVSLSPPLPQ